MEYLLSDISPSYQTFEPANLYEIDLVRQWLNISPGTIIETTNYGEITVINAGFRNKHEGPDIKDAILIINDKLVNGPVECHICTSDWYKHKHHQNSVYDSVILHVVRKLNDSIITPKIPTVLLKTSINFHNACSLNGTKNSHLIDTILHFSHNRWLYKVNVYDGYHGNHAQLVNLLINNSFRILGAGDNEQQFMKLAKNINYKKFQDLTSHECEKYLLNTSLQLKLQWVRCGIRPAQQPQNRMKLATELINYFSDLNIDRLPDYNKVESSIPSHLPSASGKGIQTELLGNIIIPFYAARALYLNKIEGYHNYYKIWNCLKIPNAYRKFEKRFGTILQSTQLKSFKTMQGLIAIDNNWCNKNLCNLCPLKEKSYVGS